MSFIKNRLREIVNDKYEAGSLLLIPVIIVCYYHIYTETNLISHLCRVIWCVPFILAVLCFDLKGLLFGFLVLGFINIATTTWLTYTSVFIFSVFAVFYPKTKYPLIIFYIISVTFLADKNYKDGYYILVHIAFGIMIFSTIGFFGKVVKCLEKIWGIHDPKDFIIKVLNYDDKTKGPELILDDSQVFILKELCHGKLQKEIDLYSENTISSKLKDAALKNNCSKDELKARFIREYL